jgi:hypothetical protein
VNETVVAAEYFYCGVSPIIIVRRQIPDTQPAHADILDLPHVNEFIGLYESGKCSIFAFKPLEFSFLIQHFFTRPISESPAKTIGKARESAINTPASENLLHVRIGF